MLYYKDKEWHISTEKVRYMQNDEEIEQYVGIEGKQWWIDFANQWEHTKIIEFILVEPTKEQWTRLEEINNLSIPDGYGEICSNYVDNGEFPEELNNPLGSLQLQKENKLILEKQNTQDAVIEEILFDIIPTMLGGLGGE